MKTNQHEYIVRLYQGAKCVGLVRKKSSAEANEVVRRWHAGHENQTAKWERVPVLENDYISPIDEGEYLVQSG